MDEKPFGIDLEANKNHGCFSRKSKCFCSLFLGIPVLPGRSQIQKFIQENQWGKIIEVNAGFLHVSDVNFDKPIS